MLHLKSQAQLRTYGTYQGGIVRTSSWIDPPVKRRALCHLRCAPPGLRSALLGPGTELASLGALA